LAYARGELQGVNSPPSSRHSKDEPGSVELNAKLADLDLVFPEGAAIDQRVGRHGVGGLTAGRGLGGRRAVKGRTGGDELVGADVADRGTGAVAVDDAWISVDIVEVAGWAGLPASIIAEPDAR
jgi:hypothetical protein